MSSNQTINLSSLWQPKPTQVKFFDEILKSPDMGLVAYVGSLGSGKTWALCRSAIGMAFSYPGIKILVGRFYSTDLRDTTQAEFFKLIGELEETIKSKFPLGTPAELMPSVGEFKQKNNEFIFSNGSVILFRPLDEAETKYKSLEIAAFGIDEASEVPTEAVMMLKARCRQKGFKHIGFVVSNPTGRDHWLYKWFAPESSDKKPDCVLFRTNTFENVDNLPPNYIENLRSLYSEDWIRRYIEGEWGDLLLGRRPVFPTFRPLIHCKPTSWYREETVFVGVDFGWHSPAVVWAQFDSKMRLQVHRCWYPKELNVYALCEGIKKRNDVWFPAGKFEYFCGHDGKQKKDTGDKASAEIMASYGMPPHIRFTHVDRGLTIIRNLLEIRDDESPGIIVDPVNERMIEGFLGGYYYAPIKSEDLKGILEPPVKELPVKNGIFDPIFDALRYIVVNVLSTAGTIPKAAPVKIFGPAPKPYSSEKIIIPSYRSIKRTFQHK